MTWQLDSNINEHGLMENTGGRVCVMWLYCEQAGEGDLREFALSLPEGTMLRIKQPSLELGKGKQWQFGTSSHSCLATDPGQMSPSSLYDGWCSNFDQAK